MAFLLPVLFHILNSEIKKEGEIYGIHHFIYVGPHHRAANHKSGQNEQER